MNTKSPSQNLRDSLNKRTRKILIQSGVKIGHLTDSEKKTPSEKRSINLKRRLNRGVDVVGVVGEDCNGCPKMPCGKGTKTCDESTRKNRCNRCGMVVVYRFVKEGEWKYCPICRSSFGVVSDGML